MTGKPQKLVLVGALGYARFAWFTWPAWAGLAARVAPRPRRSEAALVLVLLIGSALALARQGQEELRTCAARCAWHVFVFSYPSSPR